MHLPTCQRRWTRHTSAALRDIDEVNWEFAHRLFQFVAVASRPLRVKELAELHRIRLQDRANSEI
jgi:hypothetical protein